MAAADKGRKSIEGKAWKTIHGDCGRITHGDLAGAFECSLKTDEAADERVVSRMGRVRVGPGQQLVKAVLGVSDEVVRQGQAGIHETLIANGNEQRRDRLPAGANVLDAVLDEFAAGRAVRFITCSWVLAAENAAGRGPEESFILPIWGPGS